MHLNEKHWPCQSIRLPSVSHPLLSNETEGGKGGWRNRSRREKVRYLCIDRSGDPLIGAN